MKRSGSRPKIVVMADGRGVVGHAGSRLLADLADATGLASAGVGRVDAVATTGFWPWSRADRGSNSIGSR